MIRIEASFKEVDQDEFVSYFMSPPPEQTAMIQELTILEEISPTCKIMYWKMKMPMMSSRDNIIKLNISDYEGGKFIICETVEHADKPV